jgi:hypothetical protein
MSIRREIPPGTERRGSIGFKVDKITRKYIMNSRYKEFPPERGEILEPDKEGCNDLFYRQAGFLRLKPNFIMRYVGIQQREK